MGILSGLSFLIATSPILIVPLVGVISLSNSFMIVVLPDPDGPVKKANSPCEIEKVISDKAVMFP